MRSWLAVLLLVLLPLQMAWAAVAAPTAQDGSQITARAASPHCRHGQAADSAQDTPSAQVDHGHCSGCHGAVALLPEPPRHLAGAPFTPMPGASRLPASQPADLPDRPQWPARG